MGLNLVEEDTYVSRNIYKPSVSGTKKVCIFDFDGTLYMGADTAAMYGPGAVNGCRRKGYGIGIASASGATDFLKSFLKTNFNEENTFTDGFMSSQAFQNGYTNKAAMIKKILQVYGVDPKCAVFFDDGNEHHAATAGVGYQKVDPQYGVTKLDFFSAMVNLDRDCD